VPFSTQCAKCQHLSQLLSRREHSKYPVEQLEVSQSFSQRLSLSDQGTSSWTPFMKSYFSHIQGRKNKMKWPLHILIFAVSYFCRVGKTSYNTLREDLHLPSVEVLLRVTRRLNAQPGLDHTALHSFLSHPHPSGIVLSFDEIYFQSGLKMVRFKDTLITIGMNCFGTWEGKTPIENRFTFVNASELTDFNSDIETTIRIMASNEIRVDEPVVSSEPVVSHESRGKWCSETEASKILSKPSGLQAKMALHFVLSSPITPEAQGIGYVEVSSVTWPLLRALVFRIITAINSVPTPLPSSDVSTPAPPSSTLLKKNKKKNSHSKILAKFGSVTSRSVYFNFIFIFIFYFISV